MNIAYSFILSFIAGISTLIGFLFIFIKSSKEKVVSASLGISCGVMITVSILDLIPNSFLLLINKNILYTLFLILIGFLIGIFISSIIDQKVDKNSKNSIKLYKLGIISMLVLIMHNIPEGIVTFITSTSNIKLGISLTMAIALHNIPEGISISIPIYYSTKSKFKAFIYTFISGISEPIGAILAYIILAKYINNMVLGILYSIIAGMMINIAINNLYKESINYNKKNTNIYFLIGIIIMLISHIII